MQLNSKMENICMYKVRIFKNTCDLYTRIFYSNEKKMKEKKIKFCFTILFNILFLDILNNIFQYNIFS